MNTKLIMTLSALLLSLLGLSLTFIPDEIAHIFLNSSTKLAQLMLQVLGALYVAFAMLNWMAKGSHIGGIYNRPIAIANFAHFLIGALALVKALISNPGFPLVIWILACLYSIFALLFGIIFFRSPVSKQGLSPANQS